MPGLEAPVIRRFAQSCNSCIDRVRRHHTAYLHRRYDRQAWNENLSLTVFRDCNRNVCCRHRFMARTVTRSYAVPVVARVEVRIV